MMRLRVAARLLQIQRALVRHGLDDFVRATHLYRPFRFLFYLSPWTWFQRSAGITRGERLRLALVELGPIFVKFGQALSTRRDLLPVDIADELAKLQDRVPPFGSDVAVATIELAFGRPLTDIFQRFEEAPLAAASIAQVHVATLKSGEEVVVKILRPGMHEIIERDLEVLQALALLANEYWEQGRRLRPIEVVNEYRKTILDELDLLREAGNASQLKRNFAGSPLLYVPVVYWDYCRVNVMVMERIHGIIVSRIDELRARGTNFARLAENGVQIFFTQVFGTIFFTPTCTPGISSCRSTIRTIRAMRPSTSASSALCRHATSIILRKTSWRSSTATTPALRPCTSSPAGCRRAPVIDEFESAVRTVCEPIFNKPLKEISFAQVLLRLFETARRFDMQVQPQLILLQKTLLNIEGLGRQLYPELDLWKTAQPFLRQWTRERMSPRAVLKRARAQLPDTIEALKQLPQLFQTAVREASEGRSRVQVEYPYIAQLRREMLHSSHRRDIAIAAGFLWLSGLMCVALLARLRWFGWVQMGAAVVLFIWYRASKWRGE